jgi:predicted nucleotidyltransferase component of viral defense system
VTEVTEGVARSVHDRLVRYAKHEELDPTLVFTRYGVERFLYRLGCSTHAERFVLKGAVLLYAWLDEMGRATRDVDLLGLEDLSDEGLIDLIGEVCEERVAEDGLSFDRDSIRITRIRAENTYGGVRATLFGRLGAGRIKLQIDIGLGDATEPEPEWVELPTLFGGEGPKLRAYRPETVVAEKLHAIVHLGAANTRLKDYYDLLALSRARVFDEADLRRAIEATFRRRQTPIPTSKPMGLRPRFATADRRRQWESFISRNDLSDVGRLEEMLDEIAAAFGAVMWNAEGDSG